MTELCISTPHDDGRARRAVAILAWAQSVLGAQLPVHFILGGLVGAMLAENKALATVPISMTVLGSMLAAPLMSLLMGRLGRRVGFALGALAGTAGAALAVHAIAQKDFVLFCAAAALTGIYMACHNFYRFAAADMASPDFRPKAISYVMAGGLIAALLGPELVIWFQDAMEPIPFAGAYRAVIVLNLVGVLPVMFLDIPRPARRARGESAGRPWSEILADRRVVVAMLCAMVSYALMNLVMTSTPLAMIGCGFGTPDAAGVVRLHVLAMYAPSFFTGPVIARFGAPRVIAAGLACLALASMVALAGIEIEHFTAALILLGIGWNFGFIGATSMLAGAHLPEERARVQGLNDFLVMGLVTAASFGSGALMASFGWMAVNLAMLPFLTAAGAALIWLVLREGVRVRA
ncbi:MFS transporter [Limibaculum sp. M0105]|uniref:MFS transporter n=1 Tax=Thermohalobaculum xanthum TaxID=2753746 RepID=A0A8J7SFE3_9RHOB|nr:MFS transporter [Thermohalobaculum xanthum]MBK0398390.1 MFS transporter [Thermohalobaculum xanthum]